jgi:fucose permease
VVRVTSALIGTIALLAERFGAETKRFGGWMFGLAAIGGASVPLLVGYVAERSGSLRGGLAVPLVGALVMLAIFALLTRMEGKKRV